MSTDSISLQERLRRHLEFIYDGVSPSVDTDSLAAEALSLMRLETDMSPVPHQVNHWSPRDALVITYGDTFLREGEKPLHTLKGFLDRYTTVHLNRVLAFGDQPACILMNTDFFQQGSQGHSCPLTVTQ